VDYLSQIAADDLKDMPELHELRKKILKTALRYYEAFIQQSREDDALRDELVASSVQVADILSKIGNKPQAFVMLEMARLTKENVVLSKPTPAGFQQLYWIWDRQGSARLGLLGASEVQQDLQLSSGQRRQIADLTARRGRVLEEAVGQSDPARYDKLLTLVDEEEQELDRVLTPAQAQRLAQLVVQQRGVDAFRDPKVVAALQLTPEQEARIGGIIAETRRPLATRLRAPGSGMERSPSVWEQLLTVLTDTQKAKWHNLVGKPSPVGYVVVNGTMDIPPALGASLEPLNTLLVSQLGLARGQGLLITTVEPISAAARAGLRVHDILWEIDGKAFPPETTEFQKTLAGLKLNAPLETVVIRKGQRTALPGLTLTPAEPSRFRVTVPRAKPELQPEQSNP
jgi:hypothetical protein